MKRLDNYMNFSDARGEICGIVQQGSWQEMNYVTTKANVLRGNHYHKETRELIFVVSGRIKLTVRDIISGSPDETFFFAAGEAFIIEPMENHSIETLEDSAWINLLSRAMNDANGKDIFTL